VDGTDLELAKVKRDEQADSLDGRVGLDDDLYLGAAVQQEMNVSIPLPGCPRRSARENQLPHRAGWRR
jgi:hypothetical protein